MKLYYSPNLNPRVAVAVARHLEAPLDYIRISPTDPAVRDSFSRLNPNGRVPVLEEEDGRCLWETDAIVCRLSALTGSGLWRTGAEQAEMIQWISWGTHHLTRAADPLYFEHVVRKQFAVGPVPPHELEQGMRDFRHYAGILDAVLADRTWLVGGRLSYADFRVATALPFAGEAGLPVGDFVNVKRWHDRLLDIDVWREPFADLEEGLLA